MTEKIINKPASLLVFIFFFLASVSIGTCILLGQYRLAILLAWVGLFMLFAKNPQIAALLLLMFLAFNPVIRRLSHYAFGYVANDVLLLIGDISIVFIFLVIIFMHRKKIVFYFQKNRMLKVFLLLFVLMGLQVLNPLQGGLLVGLTGAKFYLVPMLWMAVGLILSEQNFKKLIYLLVGIGVLSALYGLYQVYFGFPHFERVWADLASYRSLKLFGFVRPYSIFTSVEEFSRFLQLIIFCVLLIIGKRHRFSYFLLLGLLMFSSFFVGVRTSLLGILIGFFVFWALSQTEPKKIIVRLSLVGVGMLLFFNVSGQLIQVQDINVASRGEATIRHTLSGTLVPYAEGSLKIRRQIWLEIIRKSLLDNPLGEGLGVTTLAHKKFFSLTDSIGAESFVFAVLINSGILALFILLAFVIMFYKSLLDKELLEKNHKRHMFYGAALTSLWFTTFFGNTPTLYLVGPIFYLLLGKFIQEVVHFKKESASSAQLIQPSVS